MKPKSYTVYSFNGRVTDELKVPYAVKQFKTREASIPEVIARFMRSEADAGRTVALERDKDETTKNAND